MFAINLRKRVAGATAECLRPFLRCKVDFVFSCDILILRRSNETGRRHHLVPACRTLKELDRKETKKFVLVAAKSEVVIKWIKS